MLKENLKNMFCATFKHSRFCDLKEHFTHQYNILYINDSTTNAENGGMQIQGSKVWVIDYIYGHLTSEVFL